MERGRLSIVACDSGQGLARRIVSCLDSIAERYGPAGGHRLVRSDEIMFANGEMKSCLLDSVRGDEVYVVQCMQDPLSDRSVNDNLMALVTALDAVHQSDADHITAVVPQFPYARQERKKEREGITAHQVARLLESAGAHRVVTLDVHAQAIGGFFQSATMENLHASGPIEDFIRKTYPIDNLIVVSPDVGSADRARHYSKMFSTDMAIVDKERDYSRPSTIVQVRLVGDVNGRDVLMVDDIVDTAGTILSAAELLKDKGARDICLACSLPLLNGKAVERLDQAFEQGVIKVLIGTDAVFHGDDFRHKHPWYQEVSVAPLFAQVFYNINTKGSVSSLLR
jgi:ribose-phosphate pyrophosphokinase